MKRAPTADRFGRQAASQYPASTTAREDRGVGTEQGSTGRPRVKKPKLTLRNDGGTEPDADMVKMAEQHAGASAISSRRTASQETRQTAPQGAGAPRELTATQPALPASAGKLHPCAETETTVPAAMPVRDSPCQARTDVPPSAAIQDSRRGLWLQHDQQSYVFDEITDPSLLALFEQVTPSSPRAEAALQITERERKRQFQPVASEMKKALEGVLADVMRGFMTPASRDVTPKADLQVARQAFAEMVQMLNRAKVAAVDGREADMRAELKAFSPVLDEFIRSDFKNLAPHLGKDRNERESLKTGLRGLLAQCRKWLAQGASEDARPWSSPVAPSSPEARQRALSSPVKLSEPRPQADTGKSGRLASSLPGYISPRPSQHRIAIATAGTAETPSPPTPLTSPWASPLTSPSTASPGSPRESARSFRLSLRIGTALSPKARDGARKESPVKGHARSASMTDAASRSDLLAADTAKLAVPEKETPQGVGKSSS